MEILIFKGDTFAFIPASGRVMNILFVKENRALIEEIEGYLESYDAQAFFADDSAEIVEILKCHYIDLVIIQLRTLSNLDLLRFINENFKETKVVITIDRVENDLLNDNRQYMYKNYNMLHNQLRLFDLKRAIGSGIKYSPN